MRTATIDLLDVGHHLACAARCARRLQARRAASSTRCSARGLLHSRSFDKCAGVVGEGAQELPPARRLLRLRHARAPSPSLGHALPADRSPGQLRLRRRRSAAAYRYTECAPPGYRRRNCSRTSRRTPSTLRRTTRSRPRNPPSSRRAANLLMNGSTGIAVGMTTNIPPHNLSEIIDAACAIIDRPTIGGRRSAAS